MNVEHAEKPRQEQVESSHSGRWIRDQLREVADSGLATLERNATNRTATPESVDTDVEVEKADQTVLDSLAASISTAVVEPMRNLERNRAAHQHQMEASLAGLSQQLEEFQRRFGAMDREFESAKRTAAGSQAALNELRPNLTAVETQVKQFEETFRKDLAALGSGLEEVREQVKPLDSRLQTSEEIAAKHTQALEAVARLERRRQEASRQLVTSVDGLRNSLNRFSGLELASSGGQSEPADPPAPDFLSDEGTEG